MGPHGLAMGSDMTDQATGTGRESRGLELRDHLRMMRTYWLGGTVVLLLCLCVGAAWTVTQPRTYTSTGSGMVQAAGTGDANLAFAADQLSKSQAQSFVELGGSLAVAKRVVAATGTTATASSLLSRVDAGLPENTAIITVTATGSSPKDAASLADAWITAMGAQIHDIQTKGSDLTTATTTFVPLADASVPTAPATPNVRLVLLLSGLVGVVLAFVYLLVRNNLDRRIRFASTIEQEFGTAVLGTVPLNGLLIGGEQLVSRLANDHPQDRNINFATSEALRELRTNLSYVHVDERPRIIVVTSPQPGDGKSTVAANLAESLATSSSERVVIIDCDLRRPQVSKVFGVARGAGLTDVLSGRAELADVMQEVEGVPNLWVLGAGRTPPNPSELLGSRALQEVLNALGDHAMVVLDAPPVLAVTDAVVLSNSADGVLVVVSAKKTTHDQLGRTLSLIRRGGGAVLGAVLNRVPNRGADARDYGYYGGSYAYYGDTMFGLDPESRSESRSTSEAESESESAPTPGATNASV